MESAAKQCTVICKWLDYDWDSPINVCQSVKKKVKSQYSLSLAQIFWKIKCNFILQFFFLLFLLFSSSTHIYTCRHHFIKTSYFSNFILQYLHRKCFVIVCTLLSIGKGSHHAQILIEFQQLFCFPIMGFPKPGRKDIYKP